jgi:hypothetical protein
VVFFGIAPPPEELWLEIAEKVKSVVKNRRVG